MAYGVILFKVPAKGTARRLLSLSSRLKKQDEQRKAKEAARLSKLALQKHMKVLEDEELENIREIRTGITHDHVAAERAELAEDERHGKLGQSLAEFHNSVKSTAEKQEGKNWETAPDRNLFIEHHRKFGDLTLGDVAKERRRSCRISCSRTRTLAKSTRRG